MAGALGGQIRIAGLTLGLLRQSVKAALRRSRLARWGLAGSTPNRLLLAPQDLRTCDPSFASEIYHGQFGLAGVAAATGALSPFEVPPPSEAWERELHGFGWLRHLHAAGDDMAIAQARALTADWIALQDKTPPVAWEPDVTARRIFSWLAHSPILVEAGNERFYRAFMRGLIRQSRFLARTWRHTGNGVPRLTAAAALTMAGLCLEGQDRLRARGTRALAGELERQILPDGGHISRNPNTLVDIMLDLLPLKQCFAARDLIVPAPLMTAMDRIMPMIRFFRLGDGALARFNGTGITETDLLAAVMAHDDTHGSPVSHAAPSGYSRLEDGDLIVIADVGPPPPSPVSTKAHAGCLSFEMSAARQPLIVNCGSPPVHLPEWRLPARSTAAHSTAIINDTSSCRFVKGALLGRLMGAQIIDGPTHIDVTRPASGRGAQEITALHDGYRTRFSLLHERRLRLAGNGMSLTGTDRFFPDPGKGAFKTGGEALRYAIRFHLHPDVRARKVKDGEHVLLALPDGQGWRFSAAGALIELDETVFLADPKGARRSMQIVLTGHCDTDTEIDWRLERAPSRRRREAGKTRGEALSELPFGDNPANKED